MIQCHHTHKKVDRPPSDSDPHPHQVEENSVVINILHYYYHASTSHHMSCTIIIMHQHLIIYLALLLLCINISTNILHYYVSTSFERLFYLTSTTFVLFLVLYSVYISRLFARPDDICQYTEVSHSETEIEIQTGIKVYVEIKSLSRILD